MREFLINRYKVQSVSESPLTSNRDREVFIGFKKFCRFFSSFIIIVRVNLHNSLKKRFLNTLINEHFLGKITPEI